MRNKILSAIAACTLILIVRCGSNTQPGNTAVTPKDTIAAANGVANHVAVGDKGIGKFKEVQLTQPLDEGMVTKAGDIYKAKCFSCHKLSDEKLVGPGWAGITVRRTPEWIMNFVTNTNVMLDSDLVAQQLMVICVSRMPNQNLSDEDARSILELMRKNDYVRASLGKKADGK